MRRIGVALLAVVCVWAQASTKFSGGYWYQVGQFVAQTWYEVDGKLTQHAPTKLDKT